MDKSLEEVQAEVERLDREIRATQEGIIDSSQRPGHVPDNESSKLMAAQLAHLKLKRQKLADELAGHDTGASGSPVH